MSAEFLTASNLSVRHGFFTRNGGVSEGRFASLNASLSSQDSRDNVLANRARIADALGAKPDHLLGLTQVHSADVVVARAAWAAGEGAKADALVTDVPGLALGVITADCGPVLFADTEAGVIGAAHAGWRGAASGILEATVAAMRGLGARNISASVGPCIAQASYEVGSDMRDAVLALDALAERFFVPGVRHAHFQFDLAGYCLDRLARADVTSAQALFADTRDDNTRFFSHRRRTLEGGGPIGHQLSAIVL
jgi:YfiH family protein